MDSDLNTRNGNMIRRITFMTSSEMETACREMADAFSDYEYTPGNRGMCEYLDRTQFRKFVRGYFEAAVRNGSLYCAGDRGEGYMIFETPETKGTAVGSIAQLKWILRAYGLSNGIRQIREIMRSGTYLSSEMKKEEKRFTKIEFIAVAKDYQGQGYMRKLMDYAFSESDQRGIPCILTTDDVKKVKIYEHFGMKLVKEHIIAKNAIYYEMFRDASINN